jgi:hypothetical protein
MSFTRLRLRTLLIAVAVAATAMGGWQMWERRRLCLERADQHSKAAVFLRSGARRYWDSGHPEATPCAECLETASREEEAAARHRRVARYPWLPLPREPQGRTPQ